MHAKFVRVLLGNVSLASSKSTYIRYFLGRKYSFCYNLLSWAIDFLPVGFVHLTLKKDVHCKYIHTIKNPFFCDKVVAYLFNSFLASGALSTVDNLFK